MTVWPRPSEDTADAVACNTQASATCQECAATFIPRRVTQTFCCTAHRAAFHNRAMKRGKVIMPLLLTMTSLRAARRGTPEFAQCAQARAWVQELAGRWAREDKLAGRPSMATIVQAKIDSAWRTADLEVDD